MTDNTSNNKRIAKNTLLLFMRSIMTMLLSLYTSRILLDALGVVDYGIYNVVGGVVVIMGSITASLSGASSRFITFELGRVKEGNLLHLKHLFSSILSIHFLLAGLIVIIGETVGLWFVMNKLVIPPERMDASIWVYQCSLFTAVIALICIPYNALIIAHEKMGTFAYFSLGEAVLKFILVSILHIVTFDCLILYAIFMMFTQFVIIFSYVAYSHKSFEESRTKLGWNQKIFKEVGMYTLYCLGGNVACAGYTQGLNILLNIFFGPVVNAARGISMQIQSACSVVVGNFLTAVKPQLTKSYAAGNMERMHELLLKSSKYGFYLSLILVFPLSNLIYPILNIWLKEVPAYTVSFSILFMLVALIMTLYTPIVASIHATGKIKVFQIVESSCLLLIVPIAYILLKFFSISPEGVIAVYICIEFITQIIRVILVLPKINLAFSVYLRQVVYPIILPVATLILLSFCFYIDEELSFLKVLSYGFAYVLVALFVIFIVGLSYKEKMFIFNVIRTKLHL